MNRICERSVNPLLLLGAILLFASSSGISQEKEKEKSQDTSYSEKYAYILDEKSTEKNDQNVFNQVKTHLQAGDEESLEKAMSMFHYLSMRRVNYLKTNQIYINDIRKNLPKKADKLVWFWLFLKNSSDWYNYYKQIFKIIHDEFSEKESELLRFISVLRFKFNPDHGHQYEVINDLTTERKKMDIRRVKDDNEIADEVKKKKIKKIKKRNYTSMAVTLLDDFENELDKYIRKWRKKMNNKNKKEFDTNVERVKTYLKEIKKKLQKGN